MMCLLQNILSTKNKFKSLSTHSKKSVKILLNVLYFNMFSCFWVKINVHKLNRWCPSRKLPVLFSSSYSLVHQPTRRHVWIEGNGKVSWKNIQFKLIYVYSNWVKSLTVIWQLNCYCNSCLTYFEWITFNMQVLMNTIC